MRSGAFAYGTSWCGLAVVRALETQFNLSVVEINSVGLKSGFLAALAELTLSSYFCEMVDLIVFAVGTTMAFGVARLALGSMLLVGEVVVVVDLVEAEELVEVEDEVDVEELEEQVLQSESESLLAAVCPGMLPVVVSVSV